MRAPWLLLAALAAAQQEVCDFPPVADDAPCAAFNDVVIVFDASMKSAEQDAALTVLLRTIVDAYSLGSSDGPRIALIQFNDAATVIQPFTTARDSIHTALDVRDPSVGNTCAACGLTAAQALLDDVNGGGRAGARHVVILLVDGASVSCPFSRPASPQPSRTPSIFPISNVPSLARHLQCSRVCARVGRPSWAAIPVPWASRRMT